MTQDEAFDMYCMCKDFIELNGDDDPEVYKTEIELCKRFIKRYLIRFKLNERK